MNKGLYLYRLWKKKYIKKIIRKEIKEFNYSYKDNLHELKKFLGKNFEELELEKLEKYVEDAEKKIYFLYNDELILFDDFLNRVKEETEEFLKNREKIESMLAADNLEYNENVIREIIYDQLLLSYDSNNILDYYENPYSSNLNKYKIDEKNKMIIGVKNENI